MKFSSVPANNFHHSVGNIYAIILYLLESIIWDSWILFGAL